MTLDVLGALRGLGWAVPVAVLLPNALWAVLPSATPPASPPTTPPSWVRLVQSIEWVGRAAVFIIPAFYRFRPDTIASLVALEAMALSLVFYYTAWLRYFTTGRNPLLLYEPLVGVLLPLAVSPVMYFLAASLVLRSVPLAVAAIIFGMAHVAISRFEYGRLVAGSRASGT